MNRVLYISYDGLLDPLGRSQVQPYLRELGHAGVRIWVLSFEKRSSLADHQEMENTRAGLAACGVRWRPLAYHKSPATVATAWDILRGTLSGLWFALTGRVQIVHARSYIAAVIARAVCAVARCRFVFDMRGFWADEKVEAGAWPAGGAMYRLFKSLERGFLARADSIVVLSERGAEIVRTFLPESRSATPVKVIPTCADLELFRPAEAKAKIGQSKRGLRVVYLGSLGSWYLPEEMLKFFAVLLEEFPESEFRFISPASRGELDAAIAGAGLGAGAVGRISLEKLPYVKVAAELARADFSLFFIRPSFSKQASCATKFAESLACGVPVLVNAGIGDHDRHVRDNRVGVVVERFSPECYREAVDGLRGLLAENGLSARCRALAERDFSLDRATRAYLELYGDAPGRS